MPLAARALWAARCARRRRSQGRLRAAPPPRNFAAESPTSAETVTSRRGVSDPLRRGALCVESPRLGVSRARARLGALRPKRLRPTARCAPHWPTAHCALFSANPACSALALPMRGEAAKARAKTEAGGDRFGPGRSRARCRQDGGGRGSVRRALLPRAFLVSKDGSTWFPPRTERDGG